MLWLSTCLAANAQASFPPARADLIVVGVRADSPPFSYRSASRGEERILKDYGGYLVEICRRVLSEMVSSGPFEGYEVVPVDVTAGDRFDLLDEGHIDMLCGPDSITLDRLERYNASHPVFLSGITFASIDTARFPRGYYCKAVIGLVEDTTAQSEGLRAIADQDALGLYDKVLDEFLAISAGRESSVPPSEPLASFGRLSERVVNLAKSSTDAGGAPATPSAGHQPARGREAMSDPSTVTAPVCRSGFEVSPVVFYDHHQQGVDDLCNARILYYVADFDILKRRLRDSGCEHVMHRRTLTREAYGILFRRSTTLPRSGAGLRPSIDSALYAEFNNVLLRKMQRMENILDYQFEAEFEGVEPTDELRQLFDSFKFVTDY